MCQVSRVTYPAWMDPIVTTGVVKAVGSAADDTSKVSSNLLQRALGPTADVIGAALAQYTELRLFNTERIAAKAAKKSEARNRSGPANPRVAHKVLEEGSYADDELLAEYFSGLLAASRTPSGRDDRAVFWTNVVGSLSTVQIRLHYALYREWATQLSGRTDINLDINEGRSAAAAEVAFFDAVCITEALLPTGQLSSTALPNFTHAVIGLVREGLIGPDYGWGSREATSRKESPYPQLFWTKPTAPGIELFGWALGLDGLESRTFCSLDEIPDGPGELHHPQTFLMRGLPGLKSQ